MRSGRKRQFLDPLDPVVAALGDDVGRAELPRQLLPRLVPAHRPDALGAHELRGQHASTPGQTVRHHFVTNIVLTGTLQCIMVDLSFDNWMTQLRKGWSRRQEQR